MRTNRFARNLIAAALSGAALVFGAGSFAATAEAHGHDRGEHGRYHGHRVYYSRPVVVHRDYYPSRVVVRRMYPAPVEVYRPWYYGAPRFFVNASPYYFNAGLNVYLGGANLNLQLGDPAPAGYVYVDPYCNEDFYSVAEYREHVRHVHHRAALQLVYVGGDDDDQD
jgi:hypothetical protein